MEDILTSDDHKNIPGYKFSELFDIEEIQKIQDLFSATTGVASIITEPDGTPITKPSGFCSLCNEIIRGTKQGLKNCLISDSIIGSPQKDGPKIQRCLSGGLMDGGSSIIVQGEHIANWLIGQVLDIDYKIEDLLPYADIIGADKITYKNELLKVQSMSKLQFANICDFLFLYSQQLSKYAIRNISLKDEINRKIITEVEIKNLNSELKLEVVERTIQLEEMNSELIKTNDILKREIIERQRVEDEISKLNSILEYKVKERTNQLDESNTLLTSILESSPEVSVFALDINYCYITFNNKYKEKMLQIYGINIKIGMNILETVGSRKDSHKTKENLERVLLGENFTLVDEHNDENCSRIYWQNYWSPIYSDDSKIIGITCFGMNITEQKQTQDSLKRREQILIESQKIAHTGSYIFDFITGIWTSSLELDKIFGINEEYCRSIEEWIDIAHFDWQVKLSEHLMQVRTEKKDFDFKYKIIRINSKEERWVHGLGELEFDEQGNVVKLIGTIQDITEQKLSEDALRMSEENLRITLESIGDGVITTNINQNVQMINGIAKKMTGWTQKEAMGKPFLEVFNISHENKSLTIKNPVKEVLETNNICKLANHAILTNKNGSRRNIADSAAPIKDVEGNIKGVVMVFRDVTEKKRMNERLQKYQVLVKNANDAMFFVDKEGNIIEANDAATRIYGYTFKEFSSLSIYDLRRLDKLPYVIEQMDIADKKGVIFEAVHYLRDGSNINVEVSSQGTFLGDKRVLLSIVRDITERKRAEEEIIKLSYHDQLTGLYNRRFYEEELKKIDSERNLPISLVMADVNGLKLSNDAFGHKAGDVLLRKVADILKRECRDDEIVARIGGDEFVLLFPRTDAKEAEKIVQRINVAIEKEDTDNYILSISMGFAVKEDMSDDMNEVFKKAEDKMYRHKLSESSSTRSKTIDLIMNSLYEKNNREMLHSKRVSEICQAIATKMGFEKDGINQIRLAGLMHDIGKIGINDNILNKVDKLDIGEWEEIKRHSEIGYRILSSVNEFSKIANYVLEHQERWDGKGYPKGLKGEEISIEARIIAVADSYDAMTSDRAYRKALSAEEAIKEIRKCSGSQFHPDVAMVFVEKVFKKAL